MPDLVAMSGGERSSVDLGNVEPAEEPDCQSDSAGEWDPEQPELVRAPRCSKRSRASVMRPEAAPKPQDQEPAQTDSASAPLSLTEEALANLQAFLKDVPDEKLLSNLGQLPRDKTERNKGEQTGNEIQPQDAPATSPSPSPRSSSPAPESEAKQERQEERPRKQQQQQLAPAGDEKKQAQKEGRKKQPQHQQRQQQGEEEPQQPLEKESPKQHPHQLRPQQLHISGQSEGHKSTLSSGGRGAWLPGARSRGACVPSCFQAIGRWMRRANREK
mmetsp:Transcript_67489/g.193973  ORF Transcript_67489/g.193973 Transcript_67489/m.193973 type:complete len:273 (-) Transcript_67489:19-837(-)